MGDRAAARRGVAFDDLKKEMMATFEREGYPEPYAGPGPVALEAYRVLDRLRCAAANVVVAGRRLCGSDAP